MLQSLKMKIRSSKVNHNMDDSLNSDGLNDSGQVWGELLLEIDEAKDKVLDLNKKLREEEHCRREADLACESLEKKIRDMESTSASMTKETKHLKTQLREAKVQQLKSEQKYERALNEVESCQNLANQLKSLIHDKVRKKTPSFVTPCDVRSCHHLTDTSFAQISPVRIKK